MSLRREVWLNWLGSGNFNGVSIYRFKSYHLFMKKCGKCNKLKPRITFAKKKFNISEAPDKYTSIKTIEKEIAKCELVCAICHAYRTYNRRTDKNIVLWCNSSTSDSESASLGANPSRTI